MGVIGHFVLIQRAMELVFNWAHRPLKLFERILRVDNMKAGCLNRFPGDQNQLPLSENMNYSDFQQG